MLRIPVDMKPSECDICHNAFEDILVDGKTIYGPWADMCLECHRAVGKGLGVGKGQRYERREDHWVKIEG